MKMTPQSLPLAGIAALTLIFFSGCGAVDHLTPGMNLLNQEAAVTDGGGTADGGQLDGGGSDGTAAGGGFAADELIDCGEDAPCGMVPGDRNLPCSAIDGGTCDPEGCCVPGVCRGPNQAFFEAIGRDCPQGADQDGCCIHGRSADAPGHACEQGPKCSNDHPKGIDLPCAAINGGTCEDGCCVPGVCQGPNEAFFKAIGLDGCPQGEADQDGCCVSADGGTDDGGTTDGTTDGGTSDGGTTDGGTTDGGTTDGGGTAVSI